MLAHFNKYYKIPKCPLTVHVWSPGRYPFPLTPNLCYQSAGADGATGDPPSSTEAEIRTEEVKLLWDTSCAATNFAISSSLSLSPRVCGHTPVDISLASTRRLYECCEWQIG